MDDALWGFMAETLAAVPRVDKSAADMLWLVVAFEDGPEQARLRAVREHPTTHRQALEALTASQEADMEAFYTLLRKSEARGA